jgi:hypothetical protein
MESELDAEAVQIYLDWLYTCTLRISSKICRRTEDFHWMLLKLWAVANAVKDLNFEATVINIYFAEPHALWNTETVEWAFVGRKCDNEIRDFIIDVFVCHIRPGWFKDRSKDWPEAFVSELADAAMVRWGDRKDYMVLKKNWIKKLGVELGVESDEEFTAPLGEKKGSTFAVPNARRDYHRAADLDRATSGATRHPSNRKHSGNKVEVRKRTDRMEGGPKQGGCVLFISDDSDGEELIVPRSGGPRLKLRVGRELKDGS